MRRSAIAAALAYLLLLAASHAVRHAGTDPVPREPSTTFAADPADPRGPARPLTIAWQEYGAVAGGRLPVVVLHGSPGSASDMAAFADALARGRRVLAPDLPGSGHSTRWASDYSYVAQAARVRHWVHALAVPRVHLVGFSMGGGVAITMAGAPAAAAGEPSVASLTLLSSIGVQPMELFGDYRVNHAIHGAQLALLWLASEGLPHFGALDDVMVGVPYARTFFDSDQRPMAHLLSRLEMPTLVLHGVGDPLVPVVAAREHARIVPHAELRELEADHFFAMSDPLAAAGIVGDFLARVERGAQPSRRDASPSRVRAALAPFDPATIPPAGLVGRLTLVFALALGTLVSEDAASIAAGALVAHGQLGFLAAVFACLLGIVSSDALIYGLGRASARLLAGRWPVNALESRPGVAGARDWLLRRGSWALAASRFVPGTRVVTCFAAGAVRLPVARSLATIAAAALVWTPLIVGLSMLATRWSLAFVPHRGALALGAVLVLPYVGRGWLRWLVAIRLSRPVRRWWLRLTRWEFWPVWVVYLPVALLLLPRALRARSVTSFTAANPGMAASGFVGESKTEILRALLDGGAPVAPFAFLPASASARTRRRRAGDLIASHGLPVVLKPDQGQRGAGVRILRTTDAVDAAVADLRADAVLQAYVAGPEFGVFYARHPSDTAGRIVSLTAKHLPVVVGDGRRTVAQLIDDDPRAVAMSAIYKAANAGRLGVALSAGERLTISELGSHCRGAIFLDGASLLGPALEAAVERAARAMPGFYFGRFDVRAPDERALLEGRFTILELNGVTSEPTHIYDPSCPFADGVRALVASWQLAYEIGDANAAAGARIWPARDLMRLALAHARFRAASGRAAWLPWLYPRGERGGHPSST